MKKIIIVLISFFFFTACKNEKKPTVIDETTIELNKDIATLKGEFIYFEDAAVFKTANEIYGVHIDEKMHELNNKVKAFKKLHTDMVTVEIKGKITPKSEDEEGWPLIIQIKEIISVTK